MIEYGCVYIATGKKYLEEAIISATLSRKWTAHHPICVFTDLVQRAVDSKSFDYVYQHPFPLFTYRDKILPLVRPPFRYSLFLDTDAFLISAVQDIFDYAHNFDICAVMAPVVHPPGWSDQSIPCLFGELNTGVIYIRRSFLQSHLFRNWLKLYDNLHSNCNQSWDQASFRSVLWKYIYTRRLKFLHLPSELNLRTTKPWIAGRGQRVYVIHGRFPPSELDAFESYLNSDIDRFRTSSEWKSLYPDSEIYPKFDRSSSVI